MLKLNAKTRIVTGKKNQVLRKQGLVPAVVYGHKIKNQNIQLNALKFDKVFATAGETSLIDLEVDEQKPVKVIVQDLARDVVKGNIIHIDFHQIREDEKLTVDVELEFVGTSKAIEEQGGILIKSLNAIKIECLPANLIHKIEVEISSLKEFGDVIYVKDLKISDKVKVQNSPDDAVVSAAAPRTDKELEALEEKPEETALPEGAEEAKEGDEAEKDKADDEQSAGGGEKKEGAKPKEKEENKEK